MYAIGFGRVGAPALPFLGRSAHWPFPSPRTGNPLKLVKGDVKSAQYAAWHGLGLGVVAEGNHHDPRQVEERERGAAPSRFPHVSGDYG